MEQPVALVVLMTASGPEEAEKLARLLLEKRLIACANVIPKVHSLFTWQGRLERSDEALAVMKTTSEALSALTDAVKRHHSYDVPEIIALPVIGGNPEYLSWVTEEVRPNAGANET